MNLHVTYLLFPTEILIPQLITGDNLHFGLEMGRLIGIGIGILTMIKPLATKYFGPDTGVIQHRQI
jgi:hypothetical protein